MSNLPMLRGSERGGFKRCPLAWDLYWNQGWRKPKLRPDALWFGTGVHIALADWYIPGTVRGIDPRETWNIFCKEELKSAKAKHGMFLTENIEEEYNEFQRLGEHMLGHYLEVYGNDDHWDVIAREQTFGVKVAHPFDSKRAITDFRGTFDGVYRCLRCGKLKLMEHKNYGSLSEDHLTLDDQGGTYCTVATFTLRKQGLIAPKEIVQGVEYNMLRKAYKDDRPQNEQGLYTNKPLKLHYVEQLWESDNPAIKQALLGRNVRYLEKLSLAQLQAAAEKYGLTVVGEVSKVQPAPYFARPFVEKTRKEQRGVLARIGAEAMNMARFRSGEQPMYKTPRYDCKRFCDFFDVCEIHESGGDYQDMLEQLFDREDPYADHRKSTAE